MSEDEVLDLYRSRGYEHERGPAGQVFWPSKGVVTDDEIVVDYVEKPWLSTFVVRGIRPKVRKNQARDYTNEMKAILQLAARNGRITSREAGKMCRLTPEQTSKLMRRIVLGGFLEKHGNGRGTWYSPTGKRP